MNINNILKRILAKKQCCSLHELVFNLNCYRAGFNCWDFRFCFFKIQIISDSPLLFVCLFFVFVFFCKAWREIMTSIACSTFLISFYYLSRWSVWENLDQGREYMSDRTHWGLYTRPRSHFSITNRPSWLSCLLNAKQEQFHSFNVTGLC